MIRPGFYCARRRLLPALLASTMVYLTACSGTPEISSLDKSKTLRSLPKAELPDRAAVSMSSLDVVAQSYREALQLVDDPRASEDIMRRLALLELREAEQVHVAGTEPNTAKLYRNAIQTYETLLDVQKDREDNDVLLYSLAKAQELSGDLDAALITHSKLVGGFPQSQYYSESQFRRGELLFSNQDYAPAALAYAAVIERDEQNFEQASPFLINSHYMLGWSDFKLSRYDRAMRSFVVVLDDYETHLEKTSQSMRDDAFRVMALAFSYSSGAGSIADLLDDVGERPYSSELYQSLAELYLDKKRFLDSADVYASYIQRYPMSQQAPAFAQQQIDAYVAGRFPAKVREGKRVFANTYAIEGEFWLAANTETQSFITEKLTTYIDELASYHHSLALAESKALKQNDEDNPPGMDSAQIREEFRTAAYWYEEWIRSFPVHNDIAQKYFLSAETRFEAQDFEQAIAAYEMTAYSYPEFEKANEAGYAALLAYDNIIAMIPPVRSAAIANPDTAEQQPAAIDWTQRKIESALMFAEGFAADTRRPAVLGQTVETLLVRNDYARTIDVANLLLASENLNSKLTLTGYLSRAHAHAALGEHANAEGSYRQALDVLSVNPQSEDYNQFYVATLDNYAASIYKQGEQANANGDAALAASQFQRVVELAPHSSIRVTAQHDASVLLMQTQQWQQAIALISDFQTRFPGQPENASANARLLEANQQLQNWPAAAAKAMLIAQDDTDPEAARQAHYLAADLYERANDKSSAIETYKTYAHKYTSPLAERMEAQHRLVQMYEQQGTADKRRFWIKQLVATHESANNKTERSLYLAAFASAELASEDMQRFKAVKLKNPLKQSLAKKRKAMDQVIASYDKTHEYGVAEFTTLATLKMGEVYADFASELIESERPKNLSELEREQYDMLLEEQAYPFEEEAIALFSINVERSWSGTRTNAVKDSYSALAKLMPAKYNKQEIRPEAWR